MEKQEQCAWCGQPINRGKAPDTRPFCSECHTTYEREVQRPWHTYEVRLPHCD